MNPHYECMAIPRGNIYRQDYIIRIIMLLEFQFTTIAAEAFQKEN